MKHDPVNCPRCDGTGRVLWYEPGTPKGFQGVKLPTVRSYKGICPACMGSKTVHPVKAQLIEQQADQEHQNYLRHG